MTALDFQRVQPNAFFPWFDEYSQTNRLCKVYNDGGCYVAIPQNVSRKKRKGAPLKDGWDYLFDELYAAALRDKVEDIPAYVRAGFDKAYPDVWGITDYLEKKFSQLKRNLAVRKKRFRRKAYLNRWSFFVTFTYDDEKQDAESFRVKLRKCLSNLHSRYGWLYMLVPEYSPDTNRLHYHGIIYVPEGQMKGSVSERWEYSLKKHKMVLTHPNDYFEERFGRCDFESIGDIKHTHHLNYILKYLEKSNERIIYSRGIPTEFFMTVSDDDIAAEMIDFVLKYVLFDDVVDYDVDVKHIRPKIERIYVDIGPLPS